MPRNYIKRTRIIFPIMIVFLVLYLLATPEKIGDKTAVFRDNAPVFLPAIKEKSFTPSKDAEKNYVPGQLVVKLPKNSSKQIGINPTPQNTGIEELDSLNSRFKVTSMTALSSKSNSLRQIYRIIFDSEEIEGALDAYEASGVVEYAEPNYKARSTATHPNDPKYQDGTQWPLNQGSDNDIDAPEGWDYTTGSTDTVIAIIDSGVDMDHPDLAANIWNNAGETGLGKETNGVDDDANGYIDDYQGWDWVTSYNNAPADNDPNPEPDGINNDGWYGIDDGVEHGTHVAGIAGAVTNNATGIAGVCWNCKIMALRVLDDEGWGTYTDIALAIEYAVDNGADVINMSLGGGYSLSLEDAIKDAYINDVVVVVAAGNSGISLNQYKSSPVCNDGDENRVIGVAGTNSSDSYYPASNYGWNYIDAAAPGQSIYSTVYYNPAFGFNNYYEGGWSGTSMASPHVAGLAALVKSAYPTWTAAQVRNRTINLTNNIDANLGGKTRQFGSGRISLGRALNPSNDIYPDGTLVRIAGYHRVYFLLKNGQRRYMRWYFLEKYYRAGDHIINTNAVVSEQMVLNYPRGPEIRWPDGTLFRYYYDRSKVYLIKDGKKRRFTNAPAFYDAGYNRNNIILTRSELRYYETGPNISVAGSSHPSGVTIIGSGDNSAQQFPTNYYKLYLNTKMPYDHTGYMKYYADKTSLSVVVSVSEKNSYSTGDTLRYPGGIIVGDTDTGNIYMIEYNKRRLFTGGEANVVNLGFSTLSIKWSDWKADDYPDGDPMPTAISPT